MLQDGEMRKRYELRKQERETQEQRSKDDGITRRNKGKSRRRKKRRKKKEPSDLKLIINNVALRRANLS